MKKCSVRVSSNNFIPFSFPINGQYRQSVAIAGIQAGTVVAYGSKTKIVVLISGKYVSTILSGHKYDVCTVAFERREPHIVSCDIKGNVIFWHFQDNTWHEIHSVSLPHRITSIQWCGYRRSVCYSSKEGLVSTTIQNFGTSGQILAKKSEVCAFNYDATIVASHAFGTSVTIVKLKTPISREVLRLPSKIISFDFHPLLPIIMTYTADNIMRIWKQSKVGNFSCTASLSVPSPGCFIHMPVFFPERYTYTNSKVSKIAFIDDDDNMVTLNICDNGRFKLARPSTIFELSSFKNSKSNTITAFRTNVGTVAISVSDNSINFIQKPKNNSMYNKMKNSIYKSLKSKPFKKVNSFLFHTTRIKKAKFSPCSRYIATLDESNIIIIWKLYTTLKTPFIASHCALSFEWVSDEIVAILTKDKKIITLNAKTRISKETEIEMPDEAEDVLTINSEHAIVTKTSIKGNNFELVIGNHDKICISQEFEGNQLIVSKNGDHLSAFFAPLMMRIDIEGEEDLGDIRDIAVLSIYEFAVLNKDAVHMFTYTHDNKFTRIGCTEINQITMIAPDVTKLGGRLIASDGTDIFSVQNICKKLTTFKDISFIEVSNHCDLCIVSGESFFINSNYSQLHWQERKAYRASMVKDAPEKKVADEKLINSTLNTFISPEMYFVHKKDVEEISKMTLINLLEFSSAYSLDNTVPIQMPAFPNQQILPDSLQLPEEAEREDKKLLEYIQSINGDFDMFALRYILGIHRSNKPPSFIALWLAFSTSQSQVCDFIQDDVEMSNMSQMCLAACIKDQSILENITKKAVNNTWSRFKKPELVALIYIAMGNAKKLSKLYENSGDAARASFFKRDFTQDRNRRSVIKNAYSSLSHHGFDMAAALFIAGGDLSSAVDVILEQLNDPILALLVIRLKEKSTNGPEMQRFLKKVVWDNELQEAVVSNLIGTGETVNLIKKFLSKPQRQTQLGDPRIPAYQILYHLTRSNDMLHCTVHSLLCSGLAPLASYLLEYSKCPYDKPRLTGGKEEDINVEEDEKEDEIGLLLEAHAQISESSSDDGGAFDFGGGGNTWGDDGDDWSDYDDEDEEESDSEKKEKAEEEEEEEKKENEEEKEENKEKFEFVKRFIEERAKSLTHVFGNDENLDAGKFALHFMYIGDGYSLLDENEKNRLAHDLSVFVDYCSFLFLESAMVPTSPADLFGVVMILVNMFADINVPLTFEYIKSMPQNGFIHSIALGAFAVSIWTFSQHFLAQLLDSKRVNSVVYMPYDFPPAQTLFNVDFLSPRFPDSIPNLLQSYVTDQSLDRDRLLIVFLLFFKLTTESALFTNERDEAWKIKILNRLVSIMRSLVFYQIAFSSPTFDVPEIGENPNPMTEIIINTHREHLDCLKYIQKKVLAKLATPALFREKQFALSNNDMVEINFNSPVFAFTVSPVSKTRAAVATESIYIINTEKMDRQEVQTFRQIPMQDTVDVIAHPCYELFILVTKTTAHLFDCNQRAETSFRLNLSINCAAFNPTGTKIAFAGSGLVIVSLDIGKEYNVPVMRMNFGQIYSVAWIDNDTYVAIGTDSGLFVADILTGELYRICTTHSGRVTAIHVDQAMQYLVYGTSTGKAALLNIKKKYETVCVYTLTSSIISISLMPGLCIVASSDGLIIGFNTANPQTTVPFTVPFPIKKAIALEDKIVACGKKNFVVWNLH